MGEVYVAHDSRLGRDVAVKVLPDSLALDAERMRRFQQEARAVAALNHPNILAVHDADTQGRTYYIVTELLEGETLRDKIAAGALPRRKAIDYALQVAAGLGAAHDRGFAHRDLKPENLFVTREGRVKILDFGLARQLPGAGAFNATGAADGATAVATRCQTAEGAVLGTVGYMSPEQVKGKPADGRSDIFALGAVLYEMLTGRRAFRRDTAVETMTAILNEDPLQAGTDSAGGVPDLDRIVRRCLEKEPGQRFQSAKDLAFALEGLNGISQTAPPSPAPPRRGKWPALLLRWAVPILLAGALTLAAALLFLGRPSGENQVTRLAIALPPRQELTGPPGISRDGKVIAYTAREGTAEPRLYLRNINSFEAQAVSGSDGAQQPFFSPDGRWVAFFARGQLLKSDLGRSSPVRIAAVASGTVMGGTWNEDNTIIFSPGMGSGLRRVPAAGGPVQVLTSPDGAQRGYAHQWPHALPGGRRVLFTVWGKSASGNAVLSLDTGEWKLILPGHGGSLYSPPGYLLVGNDNAEVRAAVFDADHPGPVNPDTQVLADVDNYEDLEALWLATAGNGTAVYASANPSKRVLAWVDREGHAQPVSPEQSRYAEVALSPDGTKAAVKVGYDLWIYDFVRGTHSRLTFQGDTRQDASSPEWTRDGKRVIFAFNTDGNWNICSQVADGSQPAQLVFKRRHDEFPTSVAPDGTSLFAEANPVTGEDLWTLASDGRASPWRVTQFNESNAVFSPDGRWVAYDSDETGRSEIYVQSYPRGDKRFLVSTAGGWLPRFSGNGKELFFTAGDSFMAAPVHADGSPGAPHRLFDRGPFFLAYNSYGVSPDGQRFLMIRRDAESVPRQLNVILNWPQELKRIIPGSKQ